MSDVLGEEYEKCSGRRPRPTDNSFQPGSTAYQMANHNKQPVAQQQSRFASASSSSLPPYQPQPYPAPALDTDGSDDSEPGNESDDESVLSIDVASVDDWTFQLDLTLFANCPPVPTYAEVVNIIETTGYYRFQYVDHMLDARYASKPFPWLRIRKCPYYAKAHDGTLHHMRYELANDAEPLESRRTLGFMDGISTGNNAWNKRVCPALRARGIEPMGTPLRLGITLNHTPYFEAGRVLLWFMNTARHLYDPSTKRMLNPDTANNAKIVAEQYKPPRKSHRLGGRSRVSMKLACAPYQSIMVTYSSAFNITYGPVLDAVRPAVAAQEDARADTANDDGSSADDDGSSATVAQTTSPPRTTEQSPVPSGDDDGDLYAADEYVPSPLSTRNDAFEDSVQPQPEPEWSRAVEKLTAMVSPQVLHSGPVRKRQRFSVRMEDGSVMQRGVVQDNDVLFHDMLSSRLQSTSSPPRKVAKPSDKATLRTVSDRSIADADDDSSVTVIEEKPLFVDQDLGGVAPHVASDGEERFYADCARDGDVEEVVAEEAKGTPVPTPSPQFSQSSDHDGYTSYSA